jgi:hypothetical protein
VLGVVDDFLTGINNGGEIGFPVLKEFLRALYRILGLGFELLGLLGYQLSRFFPRLGCI